MNGFVRHEHKTTLSTTLNYLKQKAELRDKSRFVCVCVCVCRCVCVLPEELGVVFALACAALLPQLDATLADQVGEASHGFPRPDQWPGGRETG
jgi:hypothetical protein